MIVFFCLYVLIAYKILIRTKTVHSSFVYVFEQNIFTFMSNDWKTWTWYCILILLLKNWVCISGRAAKIFALFYCWIAEKRQRIGDSFRIWTQLLLGVSHPPVSIDLPLEQRTELQSYKSGVGNIFTELANKIHSKICVVLLRLSTISASLFFKCKVIFIKF